MIYNQKIILFYRTLTEKSFHMSETFTLYRLMILYMLDKVDFPLTNTQITNFIQEKDYTDYFTVQQTLSELLDSDLIIAESTHNNTLYRITPEGRQTVDFFSNKISNGIKQDILEYFTENRMELKQETSVVSDYYKTTDNRYAVRCQMKNGEHPIIDLTLAVPDKEQAIAVCKNWSEQSENIFMLLMDELIK